MEIVSRRSHVTTYQMPEGVEHDSAMFVTEVPGL